MNPHGRLLVFRLVSQSVHYYSFLKRQGVTLLAPIRALVLKYKELHKNSVK